MEKKEWMEGFLVVLNAEIKRRGMEILSKAFDIVCEIVLS